MKKLFAVFVLFFICASFSMAATDTAKDDSLLSLTMIEALFQDSLNLRLKGEYLKAEKKLSRAYTAFSKHKNTNPETELRYLRGLITLSIDMKINDRAIFYGLELLEKSQNPLDTSFAYGEIGYAYCNKSEFAKASKYCKMSLDVCNSKLEPNHLNLARTYYILGEISYHNGAYDLLIDYVNKSLSIRLRRAGDSDKLVAECYNSLAGGYYGKGEIDRSIAYLHKALEINLEALGSDHPDIAIRYNNLGALYSSKGEYNLAILYIKKALEIDLKKLGENHHDVGLGYNNLGLAYYNNGEYDNAVIYCKKGLKIQQESLGAKHPGVAETCYWLGNIYRKMGTDEDKANFYYKKAYAILQKKLSPNHPKTRTVKGLIK